MRVSANYIVLAGILLISTLAQDGGQPAGISRRGAVTVLGAGIPTYTYQVLHSWPHDSRAFTQGLVFSQGFLFESTGLVGSSSLRQVELTTGRILKKIDVVRPYFAEGLDLLNGRLFQLTWLSNKGFVYDPDTFELTSEFAYSSEGWGLTHDGNSLIMSDGTAAIRFLDPTTLEIKRVIQVVDGDQPVRNLNELELIKGDLYANIWQTDRIARVDPLTGNVVGWVDLTGLLSSEERTGGEDVLNGIAYDAEKDRIFVTGKFWPRLFEIRILPKR